MSFQIQQKIKQNATEIREYVTDLYDWEKEMELREKTKAQLRKSERTKYQSSKAEAQVRQAKIEKAQTEIRKEQQKKKQGRPKDLVRDVNTVGDYYKAWDKFDADKQLQRLEEEEQRAYRPYNPYEDNKSNLRAKPKVKINVNGRRNQVKDPTELKDRGNLHFQSLQFDKAINCYTECLKKLDDQGISFEDLTAQRKKLICVVLSNRAMAYLKIQETTKALADANQSLRYNDKYSKSYYRRAQCYKKLGKYNQSLRDFKTVRKLQPNEAKADNEIKKIQAFLSKRCRELRESMVVPYSSGLSQGSRRIEITEIDELLVKPKEGPSNYLQEL